MSVAAVLSLRHQQKRPPFGLEFLRLNDGEPLQFQALPRPGDFVRCRCGEEDVVARVEEVIHTPQPRAEGTIEIILVDHVLPGLVRTALSDTEHRCQVVPDR